jgi:flagellar hook-length control protein FliK
MDQIRFDFLSAQVANALNRNAPTPSDSSDAFSQVLDQHLARSSDDATQRGEDNPRPSEDWRRSTDNTDRRDAARSRTTGRRRDDKTASTAPTAKPKPAQQPNAPTTKASGENSADTAKAGTSSGKAKPQPDDDQKDTAIAGQAANDSGTTTNAATEEKPGANGDPSGQQQGAGDKDQSASSQDADASADADLAASMIPLPLQTISNTVYIKANALPGGGATTPAMQAALLLAAGLAAGPVNLTAAGNVPGTAEAPGLKFGAVVPNLPTPQAKAGTEGAASGTTTGDDGSDAGAASSDPTTAIAASPQTPRPQANASTKARGTATASSPVTAAYTGQNGATAQPSAGAGAALPWAPANARVDSAESAPLSDAAISGDSELSAWPQYLDADTAGAAAGVSARTAAFLAELKQNVQIPPAHEQVAIQIQKAMQNGSNRLTLNLEPAELGRVEVKLDVDKDKNVTATVVVDRPATLDLLQRDAKALERALQDAGLQTNDGSLSFSLRNGAGQGGGNGANGQAGSGIAGGNASSQASDAASQPARADVIVTADGYVDLET